MQGEGRQDSRWSVSNYFQNSLELQVTAGVGVIGLIGGSICVYVYFETGNYPLFVVALAATVGIMSALGLSALDQFVEVRTLTNKATAVEEGDFEVDLRTDRSDEIGDLYRAVSGMRDRLRDSLREAELAGSELEAVNDRLERRATEYGEVMQACADGDLTRRLDEDAESEAMRSIAASFNEMMDAFEPTIDDTQQFSSSVVSASEAVRERSTELKSRSELVNGAIQQVAIGTDEQSRKLEGVADELDDLSASVEAVADSATELAKRSEHVADRSAEGQESARRAMTEIRTIEENTTETVRDVKELRSEMDRIEEIANIIADVANETNVLALNANIEASRTTSDSDREGFGIVAEEVKSLSSDVRESAEEVSDIVEDLSSQTDTVVDDMRETGQSVALGLSTVQAALLALSEVADLTDDLDEDVRAITRATDEQAASAQAVLQTTNDVTEISAEMREVADVVSTAADEQTDAISDVSLRNETLSTRANDLHELVETFTTSGSDAEFEWTTVEEPATDAHRRT